MYDVWIQSGVMYVMFYKTVTCKRLSSGILPCMVCLCFVFIKKSLEHKILNLSVF